MIICEVNKNHLNIRTRELLTAGSQNVNTVEFRFNEAWDGLAKTATFKTSKKTISVLLSTNTTAIPWEALADAGEILAVGVFGVSGETLVLPTVWGILGKVMDAAHLGDEEKEPTPDVYQKILDELNALERPTWDSVQNKPFTTLGSGLEVDENGVLSAEGGSGSDNAVQYVAQELTDEQKAQARENIGAGTSSFSGSYNDLTSKPTIPTQVTIDSTLKQSGQAADAKAVGDALQHFTPTEALNSEFRVIELTFATKLDKNQGATNAGKILGIGEDGNVIPQDKPTYTLPQATADALGGIKADAATAEDTQDVRMGADGKLRTKPTGGSSVTVDSELSSASVNPVQNKVVTAALAEKITAPTTAAVGQIIKVKSVDTAGKPTEWEAADLPSGGVGESELLGEGTINEWVNAISFSQDSSGHSLSLKRMIIYLTLPEATTQDGTSQPNHGYLRYTINSLRPDFEAPVNKWRNNNILIDIEALGHQALINIYGRDGNNNYSLYHTNYYIGEFNVITKFIWQLFNTTMGWSGIEYKLYGVKL